MTSIGRSGEDEFDIFAEDETSVDTGTFVPCAFSDDEEDEHGDSCQCVLCQFGDGGGNSETHHVLERMRAVDEELAGRVSDSTIFKLQAKMYDENVRQPLKRQGIDVPEISPSDVANHMTKHHLQSKRIMADEIRFVNNLQMKIRKEKILSRNTSTGEVRMNDSSIRQWLQLSRHKVDLLKFWRGSLNKSTTQAKAIKPYSFT